MGKITEILSTAQQRAREMNLAYEGALLPQEAYEILRAAPGAVEIEWALYPGMKLNPHFMAALEQQVDKEALVLFICRSGHRSHFAANVATQAGYGDCYNVLVGCEGDLDAQKQRKAANSWRGSGLPWAQS